MKKILLTLFSSFIFVNGFSQTQKPELVDLIKELQISKLENHNFQMAWWIPTIYWEVSTQNSPSTTPEQINTIKEIVDDYSIFAIIDGTTSFVGIESNNIENLFITTINKSIYKPLTNEEINPKTLTLINVLKPIIESMIGDTGKSMKFYFFKNKDENNNKIIDETKQGEFTLTLNNQDFKWKLPLSSLVPKKECPVDKELLSGNWIYCPWHGKKLKQTSNK
ncbi:hypothetical protein UJ101_01916 [Flavobacteriaceae bacterium UJ101]|nr:hypothetical protein UJ101_01916 [Flavobacteriaceae bacterium UJ101]